MIALQRLRGHLRDWRTWELNPVVVKELRQAVRSWAVTGTLLLFLVVLFCTSLAFLIQGAFETGASRPMGGELFQTFTAILCFTSLVFIPLYVGVRLAVERQESNLDLLYITTLTPEGIIRGKLLCGVYMTVLFFSAFMPFMAFTNLLRGIDLPTVGFILMCLFLAICAAVQVGIFVACLPVSRVLKILVALVGMVVIFPASMGLIQLCFYMMRSGIGSSMGGSGFWSAFFSTVAVVAAVVGLLYFLSVAMISPLSANRALPLRSYLTGVWLLGIAACCYRSVILLPWAAATFGVMSLSLLVVISNQDELSLRVRRQIPVRMGRRLLAFLFFNGAAGGLTWIAFVLAATYGIFWAVHPPSLGLTAEERKQFLVSGAAGVFYVLSYALTALLLQRRFFRRQSPKLAGVLGVLLPALWAVLPPIVLFFVNRLSFTTLERTQYGSIFNIFIVNNPRDRLAHLICAAVWFAIVAAIAARWYVRQWKQFRPLDSATGSGQAADPAAPPVITSVNRG